MSAPRKYDQETTDRAVRMYRDRLAQVGGSKLSARRHVGELLNPATIRNWIEAGERAVGDRGPDRRTAEAVEIRDLKREVAELGRANEILRTASAFSLRRSSTADSSDRGTTSTRTGTGSASSRSAAC